MVDMAAPTVKRRVLQGQIPTFIATGHTPSIALLALRDGVTVRKTNFVILHTGQGSERGQCTQTLQPMQLLTLCTVSFWGDGEDPDGLLASSFKAI